MPGWLAGLLGSIPRHPAMDGACANTHALAYVLNRFGEFMRPEGGIVASQELLREAVSSNHQR
jgi:hypothetical protein